MKKENEVKKDAVDKIEIIREKFGIEIRKGKQTLRFTEAVINRLIVKFSGVNPFYLNDLLLELAYENGIIKQLDNLAFPKEAKDEEENQTWTIAFIMHLNVKKAL